MTQLSVNVNKIAVLRNSRGGLLPDPVAGARLCVDAGCAGITVHPRPDRRHVHSEDVTRLAAMLAKDAPGVELNIEGNPFAPPREGYPGLLALAEVIRPAQCTLVPDGDGQLTSDHGFDLQRDATRLAPVVAVLKRAGIRVSVFVDAGDCGFDAAASLGIDRVEIYTGPYADACKRGDADESLLHCRRTAEAARTAGLAVNAGHDLDQRNLGPLLAAIPWIAEVSIGHALIADALVDGLPATVRAYLRILKQAGTGA